jgi:hypothetical protein
VDRDQKELNAILNALFGFAEEQIRKHGEFFPFAAVIAADGELRMVAVQMEEERPQSTAVIEELYRVLAPQAESGAIRAAGVCMDVLMTPPGAESKTDALRADLEHLDDRVVQAFVPYRKKRLGGYEFGELLLEEPGTPRLRFANPS